MTLMFMSFLVLINPHFPATHRGVLYRSFSLIYQVDEHFINFFCLAMLCTALPFHLLQQSNYAIRRLFLFLKIQLSLVFQHVIFIWGDECNTSP